MTDVLIIPAPCIRCGQITAADLCDVCANPKPARPHPGEHLIELAELLTRETFS